MKKCMLFRDRCFVFCCFCCYLPVVKEHGSQCQRTKSWVSHMKVLTFKYNELQPDKSSTSPETEESLERKAEKSCGLYSLYKVCMAEMGAGICSKICFGGTKEMGRLTISCAFCQDSDSTDYGKIHLAKKAFLEKKVRKKKDNISIEYQKYQD